MRRAGIGLGKTHLTISPDLLGPLYERELADRERAGEAEAGIDEGRRHRDGVFYTPSAVVDFLVEQTLRPIVSARGRAELAKLRVLDPACGCGAFLLGAYRWLCRWHEQSADEGPLTKAQRGAIARRQLFGVDIDPKAVQLARQAIGEESGLPPQELADNFRAGDALLDHDDWFGGQFSAVLTNPPYVNIRRLVKARGTALADAYRRRYRCAAGAFDLYVLFLERSVAALHRGGRIGAIVPNKLATLDYARPCRELLLREGTLDDVVDMAHLRVFGDAEVYPYIVTWTKTPAPPNHAIRVVRPASLAQLAGSGREHPPTKIPLPLGEGGRRPGEGIHAPGRPGVMTTPWVVPPCTERRVLQSRQRADRGLTLGGDLDVESQVPTAPLAELCTIHSGATGFQAEALAGRLVDDAGQASSPSCCTSHGSEQSGFFDFIVSGCIDPYSIRLGDVRFIGRKLKRPMLSADDPILTENKRRLYANPKIVLAGMARRLEAALDTHGLALGVQVYALADCKVDPLYLLGLLNSSLLSQLFRLRFAAKRLAGGYYSLSKRQLAQLPIRLLDLSDRAERRLHDRLVDFVQRRLVSTNAQSSVTANLDAQIDDLVSRLYGYTSGDLATLRAAA